jgi:hypothetical protein
MARDKVLDLIGASGWADTGVSSSESDGTGFNAIQP